MCCPVSYLNDTIFACRFDIVIAFRSNPLRNQQVHFIDAWHWIWKSREIYFWKTSICVWVHLSAMYVQYSSIEEALSWSDYLDHNEGIMDPTIWFIHVYDVINTSVRLCVRVPYIRRVYTEWYIADDIWNAFLERKVFHSHSNLTEGCNPVPDSSCKKNWNSDLVYHGHVQVKSSLPHKSNGDFHERLNHSKEAFAQVFNLIFSRIVIARSSISHSAYLSSEGQSVNNKETKGSPTFHAFSEIFCFMAVTWYLCRT